ncbi:uncharacterized protein LOC131234814 [Magnolia sinica]|uniref:uncharacterized protein LOC131234814 n=1 Tax=Magnolia sinica TaxID=86752 RepID=UPI0026593773|nr:uncharacterized protein LOC131234814 [Magnolia sinica]
MASPEGIGGNPDGNLTFPAVNADGELNPRKAQDFPVDPISSNVATSKAIKDEVEAKEKKDAVKSALIVSGVLVAVIAAIFAVSRKWKET